VAKTGKTEPRVVVIAGPNGAGKSTIAARLLHGPLQVRHYVNADVIARGLSEFHSEDTAIAAAEIMLTRLRELAEQRQSFAFETTLRVERLHRGSRRCSIRAIHFTSYSSGVPMLRWLLDGFANVFWREGMEFHWTSSDDGTDVESTIFLNSISR